VITVTKAILFRVRLIRGISAAKWKQWGLKTVPYAIPAFLLNILLINWDSLPKYFYDNFAIIFASTVLFFMLPLFMFAFRQKLELRNGYCTLPYDAIKFKVALASFVFVDDQSGVILARCDQLPTTGEGLNELRAYARSINFDDVRVVDVAIPKYRWEITTTSFDWTAVSRPLYLDFLVKDSTLSAVETLRQIKPINRTK
jgi:hypothetical protein